LSDVQSRPILVRIEFSEPTGKFRAKDYEQAARVAWRQVYRWVQAQFALINLRMVEAHEVFLPYMMDTNNGSTFYQTLKANNFKGLLSEKACEDPDDDPDEK